MNVLYLPENTVGLLGSYIVIFLILDFHIISFLLLLLFLLIL